VFAIETIRVTELIKSSILFAEDWAAFSDEYVIVDTEYEDVGRKVLNQNDLKASAAVKANNALRPRQVSASPKITERVAELSITPPADIAAKDDRVTASVPTPPKAAVEELAGIVDVVVDTSTPRAGEGASQNGFALPSSPKSNHAEPVTTPVAEVRLSPKNGPARLSPKNSPLQTTPTTYGEQQDWAVTDETRLEELLGICYKGFSCGSVGLFVPTPFGDYIAFHEGCPHFYLSMESIEAFKLDGGRNPPYVLGCIVFIEDYVASTDGNPYCLRDGTPYHIVTVTPLASSNSSATATSIPSDYGDLPMSQALAPRTLAFEPPPPPPPPRPTGGFFSSLSSYLQPTPAVPQPTVAEPFDVPAPPQPSFSPATTNGSLTQHQRISFRSFQISHLALFFLKGGKQTYVAFNEGAPNYYLATESIQAARAGNEDENSYPAYILGEIIFIDTFQATEVRIM
jgi:hypothetical protein